MFNQRKSLIAKFGILLIVSIAILLGDYKINAFKTVRYALSIVNIPVYYLANVPYSITNFLSEMTTSKEVLIKNNERLKTQILLLKQKVQKVANLKTEKNQLMQLLNSSELITEKILMAEIIGANFSFQEVVTINRGSLDGVFSGQAIVDAHGVMGQVIETMPLTSTVMLVTDPSCYVPVQINRTNYRSIAVGTGNANSMELLNIPKTTDIKKGDLLTSSGLGQRYPAGYPLGRISDIQVVQGDPFMHIKIKLLATINQSRFVILVFPIKKNFTEKN